MGTNYYAEPLAPCSACARPFERLHIGKSSYGWEFSFHGYKALGLTSFREWLAFLPTCVRIVDEYGETVTIDALTELVASKIGGYNHARIFGCSDPSLLTAQERQHVTPYYAPRPGEHWQDSAGHSFSKGDFS